MSTKESLKSSQEIPSQAEVENLIDILEEGVLDEIEGLVTDEDFLRLGNDYLEELLDIFKSNVSVIKNLANRIPDKEDYYRGSLLEYANIINQHSRRIENIMLAKTPTVLNLDSLSKEVVVAAVTSQEVINDLLKGSFHYKSHAYSTSSKEYLVNIQEDDVVCTDPDNGEQLKISLGGISKKLKQELSLSKQTGKHNNKYISIATKLEKTIRVREDKKINELLIELDPSKKSEAEKLERLNSVRIALYENKGDYVRKWLRLFPEEVNEKIPLENKGEFTRALNVVTNIRNRSLINSLIGNYGADVSLLDSNGESALDIAKREKEATRKEEEQNIWYGIISKLKGEL